MVGSGLERAVTFPFAGFGLASINIFAGFGLASVSSFAGFGLAGHGHSLSSLFLARGRIISWYLRRKTW